MPKNDSRAQAGLEYLVTYGWALVLIAAIVGAMVFIFSVPQEVSFSSSDSTKILIKGSSFNNGSAAIKLQNITGGTIRITGASVPAGSSCTIEGKEASAISESNYIELKPGQEALIECTTVTDATQPISLTYTDQAGLVKEVSIAGNKPDEGGVPCAPACDNASDCPPCYLVSGEPLGQRACTNAGQCNAQCACTLNNFASAVSCGTLCIFTQNYPNCASIGVDNDAKDMTYRDFAIFPQPPHCANQQGNCDTVMPDAGIECEGKMTKWTNCRCMPA